MQTTLPSLTPPNVASDPRWRAVLARDPGADGTFVYAVKTTGIYCRPSCPARRAKPENVEFHPSCEGAEAAGFRPCLRCRPDTTPPASARAATVAKACRIIEAAEQAPALEALARACGLSPYHFHRLFKAETGLTPKAYAAAERARRLRRELSDRDVSVTSALYGAGFGSSSRLYESADAALGMRPGQFRAGGAGATIRFAIAECSLGCVLAAESEKGVCAITLGDDPEALLRDLQDRFPEAELIGGDEGFEAVVAKVVGLVENPSLGLGLPLDIRGTAFQQRVWAALRDLKPGTTASYAEVAAQIGAPSAVRAVARACGANAIALAIPCHRVVRADGGLSGYRWGVERKRALLDRERKAKA
ncbi:MAG: bifunctional DNA-binding transcriptional regulator/O6-methylguanine-DNA methyltransferase Ada [Ancylobacter novellus]|uniref:methylated-DNA--[protein]-cysteine S-methyltransferase n=1 Tax=Ancylobacter novellus TaxID=921 RepID=A0A2W5KGD0_ANCNO|nr:MAG: bifunctional DNA-binding transcriptional regulator/O6-methylguanine-DNA methyltransferase Ada [Ancylobacter novellus]